MNVVMVNLWLVMVNNGNIFQICIYISIYTYVICNNM